MARCPWCEGFDLYRRYHDEEWGLPLRDDRALFELLLLEGAQAGLSWATILKKREHYREVFDGFQPAKIAAYDDAKLAQLLTDPGIVRNRAKVAAAGKTPRPTWTTPPTAVPSANYFGPLWGANPGRTNGPAWTRCPPRPRKRWP